MPTRQQAAEALYRAAVNWSKQPGLQRNRNFLTDNCRDLLDAVDAYSTSTPDPLPAEVQRVLEAAATLYDCWYDKGELNKYIPEVRALCEAVTAYRSTQPEPLSARLARLRPGSVVRAEHGEYRIVANDPDVEMLWVRLPDANGNGGFFYENITAILSESP